MAYEQPQLFVLSLAADTVLGGMQDTAQTGTDAAHKAAHIKEGSSGPGDAGDTTSSSSGAYEADE